jgi:hypothetical protein
MQIPGYECVTDTYTGKSTEFSVLTVNAMLLIYETHVSIFEISCSFKK